MSKETGKRITKVVDELYSGNSAAMARAMGMTPQGFTPYVNGDRSPGFKIIKRLVELGINATWIINGAKPMLIKDIDQAGVTSFVGVKEEVEGEGYFNSKRKETDDSDPGNVFFDSIDPADLSETERALLEEVKQFSDFLKTTGVPLQVKRLMLELMIEHIDQEIERLQGNQME